MGVGGDRDAHPGLTRKSGVHVPHVGGVGLTERGFDCFARWATDTARLLERCPCRAGCPSCVQSPKCGNLNELLDKAAALTLLTRMMAVSARERTRVLLTRS